MATWKILVQSKVDGQTHTIHMEAHSAKSTTVAVFKKLVYDHTNVEQDDQLLTLDGIQLDDDKTLGDYPTFGNSRTIHLNRSTGELGEFRTLAVVPEEVYEKATGHKMPSNPTVSVSPSSSPLEVGKKYVEVREEIYQRQSCQTLGREKDQISVPIHISESVYRDWIPHIRKGIAEINEACPGVCLYLDEQSRSKVIIQGSAEKGCYTEGNIITAADRKCTITLSHGWPNMKRTSLHELLHALGFAHEHQAADADKFVDNKHPHDRQSKPLPDVRHLTPMDPFSIMMYREGCENCHLARKEGSDPVWKLKARGEVRNEMSELDKVGVNLLFRPCRSAGYNPVCSPATRMWYCGRPVMQDHNRPAASTTDGRCGPNNGPNCPACRCLENPVVDELVKNGHWQGWSGRFYCGRYFEKQYSGHDGYCGPNQGPSCPECASILK